MTCGHRGGRIGPSTWVDNQASSSTTTLTADAAGTLSLNSGPGQPVVAAGSYEVESDCFMALVLEMPVGAHKTATMHFRAILVDDGHEVLGIQSDPGTVVAVRLVSK